MPKYVIPSYLQSLRCAILTVFKEMFDGNNHSDYFVVISRIIRFFLFVSCDILT